MAFGVNKVIYTNRKENSEAYKLNFELVEFEELLKKSDFLICCASLNKENENKIATLIAIFFYIFNLDTQQFDLQGRMLLDVILKDVN